MKNPCASRARRLERGEVSWVGLAMLLGFAAAAYLAWVWVPVYVRHQQVEEIVRGSANSAVKNPNDAALLQDMTRRIRALESVEVEGPSGELVRAPLIDVAPQDVTWERNRETRTLHIAFSYAVPVVYPWIERVDEHVKDVDIVADVTIPDWGGR